MITTMIGFNPKQNGCLLQSTGKHPFVESISSINVSRILGTYHSGVFIIPHLPAVLRWCTLPVHHRVLPVHQ